MKIQKSENSVLQNLFSKSIRRNHYVQCEEVNEDLYWIGASDRRLALFENIYPIPRGVSYNSYVILDEQTVLLDTVDKSVSGQFLKIWSMFLETDLWII